MRRRKKSIAYWNDATHPFVVERGKLEICLGASSGDIRLHRVVETVNKLVWERGTSE